MTIRQAIDFFSRTNSAEPPLPDIDPARAAAPPLAAGCWLLSITPTTDASFVAFDGTLRIDAEGCASGDLYARRLDDDLQLVPPPEPSAGIPVWPIADYRFYLRVVRLQAAGDGVDLAFEAMRFSAEPVTLLDGRRTKWPSEGAFVAHMVPAPAPRGLAPSSAPFEGDVHNAAGAFVGRLTMHRVSAHLRKATLEIDHVPASEPPLHNGAGVDWATVYGPVGWDLTVALSDGDVEEPPDGTWNEAEAHAALARRDIDAAALDREWRWHLLAVRFIDVANSNRGVMYDRGGDVPREGLMVASHWVMPEDEPVWGTLRGRRAAETVTYFRTAAHELGHAMGLEHEGHGFHFMRGTNELAADSGDPPFPDSIAWSFSRQDTHRLRHWPDLVVRPGGLGWAEGGAAPSAAVESDRHRLDVRPLLGSVPIGAPVRVELSLANTSDRNVAAPPSLDLASGHVRGFVVDATGTARSFGPLIVAEDAMAGMTLAPGEHVDASLTLLAGEQGMLFPAPGAYRVVVEASWFSEGLPQRRVGDAAVRVNAATDAAHAEAARLVLSAPGALRVLAFGGDHEAKGIAALQAALANATLRPHVASIEAKRLAQRFGKRPPDRASACALIDDQTVLSRDELRQASRLTDRQ